jgi:hypothetical protein
LAAPGAPGARANAPVGINAIAATKAAAAKQAITGLANMAPSPLRDQFQPTNRCNSKMGRHSSLSTPDTEFSWRTPTSVMKRAAAKLRIAASIAKLPELLRQ